MPETVRKSTTLAPTRRDALVGAIAFPAAVIATKAVASPPVELSPEFNQLRSLAMELGQVDALRDAIDEKREPLSAKAGDVLIADLSRRIDALVRRIHSKPITTISDVLDRAAVVLFWSGKGQMPGAWRAPEASLLDYDRPFQPDPDVVAAHQLAAAVFALAHRGGVNV
ncbi:hypothetical protein [Hyphomicrobium sp. 1Nfss2.1]|uniref:hypothetical protein n=1 Tax=Hyphomicrobium sp. 1Nfss2.1 TaxID=3413936 RepID=UPI003C7A103F